MPLRGTDPCGSMPRTGIAALSLDFLHNQDWVWGVGLMVSGFFFALAARKFGVEKLRTEVEKFLTEVRAA